MKAHIFMLLLTLLFFACSKREAMELTDGYRIVREYGDVHFLVNPDNKILVFSNVTKVRNDSMYIVGLREIPQPEKQVHTKQAYGFFVYEKRQKLIHLGLMREDFDRMLQEKNINLAL